MTFSEYHKRYHLEINKYFVFMTVKKGAVQTRKRSKGLSVPYKRYLTNKKMIASHNMGISVSIDILTPDLLCDVLMIYSIQHF